MVGDIVHSDSANRDASEMTTYRSQLGVGVNLLVSMGTMFCVGFYAGGTEAEPYGVRATICGLLLCILTMLIEIVLFVIGASRIDERLTNEAARIAERHIRRASLKAASR